MCKRRISGGGEMRTGEGPEIHPLNSSLPAGGGGGPAAQLRSL